MKKLSTLLAILIVLLPLAAAQTVTTPTTRTYLPITENSNIVLKKVSYDPTPAEPGNYVDVFVVVQNLGNKDMDKSWLKLDGEFPFHHSDLGEVIQEVDLIPSGREELLEYRLLVDDQAIEGDYTLELIHCADSKCKQEIRKSEITIKVKTGGKPKLEIGLEDSELFLPSTLGEITVSAVNRGKLGIKFLTIEIMESEDYEIISPARVYIGELNSDDFETESFQIFVDSAISAINVPVKVEYSDENFKEYAGVENIELRVFNEEQALHMGLISENNFSRNLIYGISAIVILFFLYRWRKRKKNEH